jgi:hypothetical protein
MPSTMPKQLSIPASDHSLKNHTQQQDPEPSTPFFDLDQPELISAVPASDSRNKYIKTAAEHAHEYLKATLEKDNNLASLTHQYGSMLWFGTMSAWTEEFAREHPDVQVVMMNPASEPDHSIKPFDSQNTLKSALKRSSDTLPNLVYCQYDREKSLPQVDKSTMSVLVEDLYLYEPDLLNEVLRVLSPGGRALFITIPNWKSDCPRVSDLCKAIERRKACPDDATTTGLLTTLQQVGFVDVRGKKFSWCSEGPWRYRTIRASISILRTRALVYGMKDFDAELSLLHRELICEYPSLEVSGEFCFATAPAGLIAKHVEPTRV